MKNDKKLEATEEEKSKQDKKRLTNEQKRELNIFMFKGIFWITVIGFILLGVSEAINLPSSDKTTLNIAALSFLGFTFLLVLLLGTINFTVFKKVKSKNRDSNSGIEVVSINDNEEEI